MKIVGLITEYNPFHNGHSYHIQKAKELTGADAVLVVMSGDFVQRGAPAIMPKHLRAECALLSGASLVLELPVCYATASAEHFAMGAISLLHQLGCVDAICFGSECGDIQILEEIADLLVQEPDWYQVSLKEALKNGMSFPQARQTVLEKQDPRYASVLSAPNNILGIEYLKALKKLSSLIKPYTITRAGAGYHDISTDADFCSATALRASIHQMPELAAQMPRLCYQRMQETYQKRFPVEADDFSLLLKAKLLTEDATSLTEYADVSEELANRILRYRNDFQTITQFCELLKTKELTYSRISRCLFHILLQITDQNMVAYREQGIVFYARVLGFHEDFAPLFTRLKSTSRIPLLTRLSQADGLTKLGATMLDSDLYAADLYESVVADRFHQSFINERSQPIRKISKQDCII